MKILILAYDYAQINGIGSKRMTNLSEILADNNEVTIITNNHNKDDYNIKKLTELKRKLRIIHSGNYIQKSTMMSNGKRKSKIPQWLLDMYWWKKVDRNNYLWAKRAYEENEDFIKKENFDVVISSFFPYSVHFLAEKIKTNNEIFWIADFRDLMEREDNLFFINIYYKYLQKRFMRKADAITVVSRGSYMITEKNYKDKLYYIPNGYDGLQERNNKSRNQKLNFCYAGILYNGKRDLSVIFRALKELADENKIISDNVNFNYCGRNGDEFRRQARVYGMEKIVSDYGLISGEESIKLQMESDILTVVTWNTKKEKGIVPGKIYEYMSIQKPIIAINCGNISGAEINNMVKECNLGETFEYPDYETSLERLKKYIYMQYKRVINDEELSFEPDIEKRSFYSRKNTAEMMLDIIRKGE